ncbi:hypothetical protein XENTR_v10009819 [Xenopus tropicalis]|uniref:U6 snRNA-associated Sm-like protein LSm1 n=3 Tax=Pipidae TaxID=8352 RepID=F7B5H3_XENTR|nr:hypothetical protein XENTR_v10009819 [Xenopus tropicalis]
MRPIVVEQSRRNNWVQISNWPVTILTTPTLVQPPIGRNWKPSKKCRGGAEVISRALEYGVTYIFTAHKTSLRPAGSAIFLIGWRCFWRPVLCVVRFEVVARGGSGKRMNYMPGTASLIEDIDKKHLVLLRDGRTLIGYLRSIDQFANLVLHQTVERIHVGKKYGDIPRGIFVVRGENVVLLGEIDLEKESDTPLLQVSIEEILEDQRVEQQSKNEAEKLKVQALKERGLSIPRADTLDEY